MSNIQALREAVLFASLFLGLSTVGLLIATWVQFIKPAISG